MNGIHDMGGMTCFGPVDPEDNEPIFHEPWEARVFAMSVALAAVFGPIDARRHALERMDPAFYLHATYYERWRTRLEAAAKANGLISEEEIVSGVASGAPAAEPPPDAAFFDALIKEGRPSTRDTGRLDPRFATGDRVRACNIQPAGHTRLPRYVRGRRGTIERCHGTHVFPDTNAHGEGENPQPLYTVRFLATELWGPRAAVSDSLYIDLWEDYLRADD